MSTDAIVMLKQDHKEIRKAFRDFSGCRQGRHRRQGQDRGPNDRAADGPYLPSERSDVPRVRDLLPELENDVLESYDEHHVADVLVV